MDMDIARLMDMGPMYKKDELTIRFSVIQWRIVKAKKSRIKLYFI